MCCLVVPSASIISLNPYSNGMKIEREPMRLIALSCRLNPYSNGIVLRMGLLCGKMSKIENEVQFSIP